MARGLVLISEYSFEVRHTLGKDNGPAGYLSRKEPVNWDRIDGSREKELDGMWSCEPALVVGLEEAYIMKKKLEQSLVEEKIYLINLDISNTRKFMKVKA